MILFKILINFLRYQREKTIVSLENNDLNNDIQDLVLKRSKLLEKNEKHVAKLKENFETEAKEFQIELE